MDAYRFILITKKRKFRHFTYYTYVYSCRSSFGSTTTMRKPNRLNVYYHEYLYITLPTYIH